jgi:hypothetical protein
LRAEGKVRSRNHTSAAAPAPWRAVFRRHLAVLLAIKLAALALLWVLFFSPAHRTAVDGQAADRHLALVPQEDRRD